MIEFIGTIESNPTTQKDIELIVNIYSNQSYRIQSQNEPKDFFQ